MTRARSPYNPSKVHDQPCLYEIGQVVEYVDLSKREEVSEPQPSDSAFWYCVTTNPNCQARASMDLHSRGFSSFYPKKRQWVSHARVKKAVERPLLGRYVFVQVDHPRQSFGSVKATNGIEGFISNRGSPTPFPAHWVHDLRFRYMRGEWDEVAQGPIPVGARIRIVAGEFEDMLATVTGIRKGVYQFKIKDANTYGKSTIHGVRAA